MAGWENLLPKAPPAQSAAQVYDAAIKGQAQRQQMQQTAQYNQARTAEQNALAQQRQRANDYATDLADAVHQNSTMDANGNLVVNQAAIRKAITDKHGEMLNSYDEGQQKAVKEAAAAQQQSALAEIEKTKGLSTLVSSIPRPTNWADPKQVDDFNSGTAVALGRAVQSGMAPPEVVNQLFPGWQTGKFSPDTVARLDQVSKWADGYSKMQEEQLKAAQIAHQGMLNQQLGEDIAAGHIAAGVAPAAPDSNTGATPITVSPTSVPAVAPVKTGDASPSAQPEPAATPAVAAVPMAAGGPAATAPQPSTSPAALASTATAPVSGQPPAQPTMAAKYTGPPQAPGLVTPGNIDLANRPIVKNADGTTSTVKTATFGIDGGRTVLLPTIVNGAPVSEADAFKHYQQTGEHMGIFQNEDAAEKYDQNLHNQMEWNGPPGSPQAAWQASAAQPTSAGAGAPVVTPPPTDPYLAGQQAMWDAQRADPANKAIAKYMSPTWSQKNATAIAQLSPKFKEQQEVLNGQVAQAVGSLASNPPKDAAAYGKVLDSLPDAVAARLQATVPLDQYDPKESPDALNRALLTPEQRYKADNPSEGAGANKAAFQGILQKIAKNMPAGALSDARVLASAIKSSPLLTQDEKNQGIAYLAANNTPAATGTSNIIRMEGLGATREYPVINKATGQVEMRSANEINASRGNFAPAGQGATAMSKQALFSDLHYNIDTARKAIQALPDMDVGTRAALSYALRGTDPHSAIQTFLTGSVGTQLSPQQQEAVQSLALLAENAMTLRSVGGMGAGSDELRSAILATIPSGKTPSKDYAMGQLNKFEAVVRRLEGGVPKVGTLGQSNTSADSRVPPKGHMIQLGNKNYSYKGAGDPTNLNNYDEVKP